ncbi:MAG: sulfatase-like hydrolase/transferase [Planctomycetota bacterium]
MPTRRTSTDSPPTLGCYGDKYAYTPNIDRLSSQSVRYKHVYANAPVCTPARSSIITGVFASSLGTQHLRGVMPLSDRIKGYPEYLRRAGYYCTNNVKEDYNFETPPTFWDESSDTAHWRKGAKRKPFFSIFNLMTTHQSRTRYEQDELDKVSKELPAAARRDPAKAPLPPYYPDSPRIRTNVAVFYTQVARMDRQVADILKQLDEDGLAENTIVFFYSDHGSGLPRGKRWLHDTGLRVPLIIRFPKKYRHLAPSGPGTKADRMVSFVDLPATVLSLVGIEPPDYMQGTPFLGRYNGKPRTEIFAIRDRVDEVLEFSRTVHDGRYQYIRNFMPHRPRMQRSFFSERTPLRQEIRRLHAEGQLKGDRAWLMSPSKPAEELYDLQADPWEMNNLAAEPQHAERLKQMRQRLYAWMLETRDLSLLHENDMIERAAGRMPYEIARDDTIYPTAHILNVAERIGQGSKHVSVFKAALDDPDPAVRYWAATGLAVLGKEAEPARGALREALSDPKSWVRFAAAESCCKLGLRKQAVRVLADGLALPNIKENLHAAEILVALGKRARPALPQMKQAVKRAEGLQDHGWYMREALTFLIGELERG